MWESLFQLFGHQSQSPHVIILCLLGAFSIGLSKSGLSGCSMISVLVFAEVFGARESTGIVLPMLISADIMAYLLMRKGGSWKFVVRMAIPAMLGVILGVYTMDHIDNLQARRIIGILILIMLITKWVSDYRHKLQLQTIQHPVVSWIVGIFAGIATMLANAAGPVMSLYLLRYRNQKADYLGSFARFFLFINLFKIPFSTHLGLIHPQSLQINLILLPVVMLGLGTGWMILKRLPMRWFEKIIIVFTLIAAIRLISVTA